MTPAIGRIVHYRLPSRYEDEERWRPAQVVNTFGGSRANLTVFLDGLNDGRDVTDANLLESVGSLRGDGLFLAVGSAEEGTAPGEWRWPQISVAAQTKGDSKKDPEGEKPAVPILEASEAVEPTSVEPPSASQPPT